MGESGANHTNDPTALNKVNALLDGGGLILDDKLQPRLSGASLDGVYAQLATSVTLVGGLIPTSMLPALALTNVVTVASQAAMLALTAAQVQPGDVAVRTDDAGSFMLSAANPALIGSWVLLNAPADLVSTVNGQTGTVVLAAADVGAATTAALTTESGTARAAEIVTHDYSIGGALTVAVGARRVYNDTGRTLTIIAVRASAITAPTGAAAIFDVTKNGTSIYTTQANRPSIAIGALTGTGGTPDLTWANGEYLTADCDQIGSTIAGADATLTITAR